MYRFSTVRVDGTCDGKSFLSNVDINFPERETRSEKRCLSKRKDYREKEKGST